MSPSGRAACMGRPKFSLERLITGRWRRRTLSTRTVRRAALGRRAHITRWRHDGIGTDILQAVAPLFGRLRPPACHQCRLLVRWQVAEAFEGRVQALPLLGCHRLPALDPLADRRLAVGRQVSPLVCPL